MKAHVLKGCHGWLIVGCMMWCPMRFPVCNNIKTLIYEYKTIVSMSTEISVSNSTQQNCKELLKIMQKYGQDCRVIETVSVVENKIENGCSIAMDTFKDKTQLIKLWKIIKTNGNYNCAYIKVDGQFAGCINDYIR
jgi:hypothetical protein